MSAVSTDRRKTKNAVADADHGIADQAVFRGTPQTGSSVNNVHCGWGGAGRNSCARPKSFDVASRLAVAVIRLRLADFRCPRTAELQRATQHRVALVETADDTAILER